MAKIKKRQFDSVQQKAYLSLWRTYDKLRVIEENLFSRWEITPQQYNVLRLLEAASPNPLPTLVISSRLISRAPDITRILDKLESRQWIERVRSIDDRRTVLVTITQAGRQLLAEIELPLRESHLQQLGHLPVSELKLLCDILKRVRQPHESEGSDW